MIDNVLGILAGLTGLGGLISVVVNLLKRFGVVADGTSERWVQGLNLAAFIIVAGVSFFNVNANWVMVDSVLGFLVTFLGFVMQLLGSRVTYSVTKGMPLIGFSFNTD
jgi:hypothetical protein